MLGVAPDNRGLLPEVDVARLKEFGAALRDRVESNLALQGSAAAPEVVAAIDNDPDTLWSAPTSSHHAELEVSFDHPVRFDHAITMEWLNAGQHVQKYAIEAWDDTSQSWDVVIEGQAIGHKKIDVFPPVTASRVRLNILSSTSEAHIREFQLYDWSAPTPIEMKDNAPSAP
jgi:alpha-L-fucosidase